MKLFFLVTLMLLGILAGCDQAKEPVASQPPVEVPKTPSPVTEPVAKPSPAPTSERVVKKAPAPSNSAPITVALAPKALDLSLPDDFAWSDPEELQEQSLLPQLLQDKQPDSVYQLSGRLLTNDNADEGYWDSVEGAELQIEFRH